MVSNTFHRRAPARKGKPRRHFKKRVVHKKKSNLQISKAISGVAEMRRRESGLSSISYANQGPQEDETYLGLSTTQSSNIIVDPLNWGWQNNTSNPTGATRDFRGKDIFVRYHKMKYKFDFPMGDDSIRSPMRLQLVWGFCTNPTQYTPYTTPTESTVSQSTYESAILAQVEDSFNSPDDQLLFRIKNKSNVRILGKKWIRPDRTARVGVPQVPIWASGSTIEGGPPDVTGTISWPCNRKMRLTYTNGGGLGVPGNFNNESWIPFVMIYSPDYDSVYNPTDTEGREVPEDRRIQFQHNSCLWYQDP